jgi:RNA polymerase sigma-70 factor (ECF subfamily)
MVTVVVGSRRRGEVAVSGAGRPDERFEALYDAHRAALGAYCRRRVPGDLVEDVLAEIFVVAWRRFDQIPDGSELPWLYGVARKVVANQRRGGVRRMRLVVRVFAQQTNWNVDVGAESTVSEDVEPILDALASLAPSDQEVLRLRAWEELSGAEIAVVLGITIAAADMRLSRARRRLERALVSTKQLRLAGVGPIVDGEVP